MKHTLLLILTLFSFNLLALELNNDETISFDIDGSSLSEGIFINIPANATTLSVNIENGVEGSDFDLFMKFGTDFSQTSFDAILHETDYYSAGADAEEFFSISTALNIPLKEGRWYIAIFNFDATSESINLTASYNSDDLANPEIIFIFDQPTVIGSTTPCNIAGWNDDTSFTPVAGNNATTLGQARKNAVLKAADLMTENLQSTVPVIIQGCWPTDLETSATSAVLANAGARVLVRNTVGLNADTWYPVAISERQAGTRSCKYLGGDCDHHSILINFNPKIDTDEGLGSARWYYGLDNSSPTNNPDFVSTALHEMTHGLGFASTIFLADEDKTITCPGGEQIEHTVGTMLCNTIDIYSSFLVLFDGVDSFTALSDGDDQFRENAFKSNNKLLWNSEEVATSEFNTLSSQGIGLAQLYAPTTIKPGSSVSHFSRSYRELMGPVQDASLRQLGLATPLLWDVGWDPRPKNVVADKPEAGLYYDSSKNGHGFVIEPIANSDLYFTVFYTYKDDGTPEWYTSLSTLKNNVLNIDLSTDPNNGALNRFIYDFDVDPTGAGNPNTLDSSVGTSALKIDFNSSVVADSTACSDGTSRGDGIALATWQLGSQTDEWCIEPLANVIGAAPAADFGGTWWTGIDDDGWGLSLSFTANGVIVATIYYFDATGSPRWVQGTQSGFQVNQEITLDLLEFSGYARDETPVELTNVSTGSLAITINDNGVDGSIDLDITYQGDEGGEWIRSNVPVTIFTAPHE